VSAGVFDEHAGAWAAWQETPWARLRYRLVARTLAGALDRLGGGGQGRACRVLDVGGGDGADSLPLAEQGHEVTILDYAEGLLARAGERAAAGGLTVRTIHADLAAAPPDGFDLVLCHNMLHYLPDADLPDAVRRLVAAARPGGMLSVLAPNPAMDVFATAVRRTDPAGAAALLDAPTIRSETFDHEMGRLDAGTVEALLVADGCTVERRYGIRCVTDLIADDDLKHDPAFFADLERLEFALCDLEPYRRMARFWQLVVTRAG